MGAREIANPDFQANTQALRRASRYSALRGDLKVLLYQGALSAASLLPHRAAFGFARAIGREWYRRHRDSFAPLFHEMEQVLGCDNTEAYVNGQRYFEVVASENIEAYMRNSRTRDNLCRLMEFRGLTNLDASLKKGKGAILCTGHIRGLFTFMFGLHSLGYKVNAVRRLVPELGGPITNWFTRRNTLVTQEACNFLWMENGVNLRLGVHSAAALSRNEILIMLIDARQVAGSLPVKFLGHSMSLPSGHVVLAQATGASLLNFFIHRPTKWVPQIAEIGEPYDAPPKIEDGVQHCLSILERQIRQYPTDWTWFAARDVGSRF